MLDTCILPKDLVVGKYYRLMDKDLHFNCRDINNQYVLNALSGEQIFFVTKTEFIKYKDFDGYRIIHFLTKDFIGYLSLSNFLLINFIEIK